jgi:hypothetical protein
MKSLILALIIASGSAVASSKLPTHNYKCIADSLQAYNSDIYYDLSSSEIDDILSSQDDRRGKVEEVTRVCDGTEGTPNPKLDYACISSTLEAYNSSVYYDLSPSEIDELLHSIDGRSWKVREVAGQCSRN